MPPRCVLSLSLSVAAQVIDLSRSGVLLASRTELAVGERGDLHMTVGATSLQLAITVRHVFGDATSQTRGRYYAGAVFGPMSAEQQVLLDRMLDAGPRQ